MKIIAITQARYGSSRFKGKVLKEINDKTLLEIHLERVLKSKKINKLIVATTLEDEVYQIIKIAKKLNLDFYQGSTTDVLDRFYKAAEIENPDYIVRITSDCPLIDAGVIDSIIEKCTEGDYDYCSNTLFRTFPDGLDVEVFKFGSLQRAWQMATDDFDREHVTPFIWKNSTEKGGTQFKSVNYKQDEGDDSGFRLTVDYESDFKLIEILVNGLGYEENWRMYIDYIRSHPFIIPRNHELS